MISFSSLRRPLAMSALALGIGWLLGPWGFGATIVGVLAAWAYSAEPVRLKRSGWWGPGLVGLSYETLPWFTGAAVLSLGAPSFEVVTVAVLYGLGAHGIMTLNDFKALEGDRQMGVRSIPVQLGPERAATYRGYDVEEARPFDLQASFGVRAERDR